METKDILKRLRKSTGLSMQEFCSNSGISFSTYQNYETGKRLPTADMLIKIADYYNVSVDYLLCRQPMTNIFAGLNLTPNDESDIIEKYMSLPPEVRAMMLDVLRQLGKVVSKDNQDSD